MIDDTRATAPDIAQADRLYRGFPDFVEWGSLTSDDIDLWERVAASLAERRKAATPEMLKAAVEVAVRAAALDTGAIEGLYSVDRGFTMTVAVQGLAWQQMIEERGEGVRELFEAQLAAYELVLDAVTRKLPITEAWIRALHEKLCDPQKTYRVLTEVGWQHQDLPKGQYKTHPNHVLLADGTFHAYAPVDRVPSEMHRFLQQLRTPEFEAAHPVLQASYCHYALVVIHPFADGNGRVARALASTFYYRAQSIPLVIFANQRPAYLDALARADRGDYRPVIAFFQDRGIDTMQLVVERLMTETEPKLEDLADRIRTQRVEDDLSVDDLETIARRLLTKTATGFGMVFKKLDLGPNLSLKGGGGGTFPEPPLGYRPAMRDAGVLRLAIRSRSAISEIQLTVYLAKKRSDPFRFLLSVIGRPADDLPIRLEDVFPSITEVLKLRLKAWIQRQLSRMLADLEQQTKP